MEPGRDPYPTASVSTVSPVDEPREAALGSRHVAAQDDFPVQSDG
jgi:hypothetical protein